MIKQRKMEQGKPTQATTKPAQAKQSMGAFEEDSNIDAAKVEERKMRFA